MSNAQRRSRMKRTRSGKRVELTSRDIEIFRALSRLRYLSSTTLHALVGGQSTTRFKDRLTTLFHEGFIDRPQPQWLLASCRHAPVVHELGAGAAKVLRSEADEVAPMTPLGDHPHRQFQHSLMICEVLASIDLQLRQFPGRRLIGWQEIIGKATEHVRSSERPLRFAASVVQGSGSRIDTVVEPDAVFGIEYQQAGRTSYRFFALEADRGTMPIVRSNMNQSSYFKKILAYRDVIARQIYKSQLGLPNLLVLTVTTSEKRMHEMMSFLQESFGASAPFLFKVGQMAGHGPDCATELMMRPWLRVGHPPLAIENPDS